MSSRESLALIACMLTAAPLSAQRIDRRIAIEPDASIRITSLAGTIRVIGWDRDSIVVTGTVPTATGQLYFGGGGRSAKLGVEPRDAAIPADADLEIRVPSRARLWVKTDRAAVVIEGVSGSVDAYAVSGGILIRGAPRQTYAESMDGPLEVEGDVTWLRLKTADGRIAFRGGAEDAAVTSVSGEVRINGGRYGRIRVETITGNVVFDGVLDRAGTYTFDTHSGSVDLRFLPPVDVEVEVANIAGKITNLITGDRPAPGRSGGLTLNLIVGQGGGHVMVRTFKGEVRLKP